MSDQRRASAWVIEEYADGEPIDEMSCRPLSDPDDPGEPRWQAAPDRRSPGGE